VKIAAAYQCQRSGGEWSQFKKIGHRDRHVFLLPADLTTFWAANRDNPQSLNNIEKGAGSFGDSSRAPRWRLPLDVEVEQQHGIRGQSTRLPRRRISFFVHLDQAYQAIINDLPSQTALHQISLS